MCLQLNTPHIRKINRVVAGQKRKVGKKKGKGMRSLFTPHSRKLRLEAGKEKGEN